MESKLEKMARLKNISVSLLVILSLFASTVAACCCSHHQEKVEIKVPSCHQTSHEKDSATTENLDFLNIPCVCLMESAPKVFAKSESIRFEKQTAKMASIVSIKFDVISPTVSVEKFVFAKPFYLSDSFYNQKSPRAPPFV